MGCRIPLIFMGLTERVDGTMVNAKNSNVIARLPKIGVSYSQTGELTDAIKHVEKPQSSWQVVQNVTSIEGIE